MSQRIPLTFEEISQRLRQVRLPEVDLVVGIATGGTVPASLLAYQLGCTLAVVHINYRAEDNTPQRPTPILLSSQPLLPEKRRILLVDDVSVSGQTLALAKTLLAGHDVITFVLKGRGDYTLFPEIAECVEWPWKLYEPTHQTITYTES